MGDGIRFRLAYKVFLPVENLFASVVFRCEKTREIVTTSRHVVSGGMLLPEQEGEFVVEFSEIPLRPKEYPLYFWLGNNKSQPFDVVDDVVATCNVCSCSSIVFS